MSNTIAEMCEKEGFDVSNCYDTEDLVRLIINQFKMKIEELENKLKELT